MKLRVGLIGLGDGWKTRHQAALRALSDRFEIRAVCCEVACRAEQVAKDFEATPVDGFRALTMREDIDAVLMLSTGWYGALPILAACEAGKAVFCSAALDIEPDSARDIKQRVERSGVAFMAEFPRRHAAATLRLKELIATRLGKPRLLFCHQRLLVDEPGAERRSASCRGAVVREMMELVDWCRYVVGQKPTSVVGIRHAGANSAGHDDYRMMSLDFSQADTVAEAAMAQISCGHYMPRNWTEANIFRPPAALQVCCENGVAFIDLPATIIWFDEAGRHLESLESERPVGEQLLVQFHREVTSLVRKTSDLEDAYFALRVVTTAQQSCRTGQRLPLDL